MTLTEILKGKIFLQQNYHLSIEAINNLPFYEFQQLLQTMKEQPKNKHMTMTETDILFLLEELLHHNLSKKEVTQQLLEREDVNPTSWVSTTTHEVQPIDTDVDVKGYIAEETCIQNLHLAYHTLLEAIKDVKTYHVQQRNYEQAAADRDVERTILDLNIDKKYLKSLIAATETPPITQQTWEKFLDSCEGECLCKGDKYQSVYIQEWTTEDGKTEVSLHLTQESQNKYQQHLMSLTEYNIYLRPEKVKKVWVREKLYQELLKATQRVITQKTDITEDTLLGKYGLHLDNREYYNHLLAENIRVTV
jgi:hypothetical protein